MLWKRPDRAEINKFTILYWRWEERRIGLWPTAGVDEDFDRAVVSVLVSQSDDDAGGRAGQRVCISADSVRWALYTYTEKQPRQIK